jgi:peptide/nickel transport system permease protein
MSADAIESVRISRSPFKGLLRRLLRDPLAVTAVVWILVVLGFLLASNLGVFRGVSELNMAMRNRPPGQEGASWQYLLGSDALGRSLIARLATAAGPALFTAFSAVLISLFFGTFLGLVAGYFGGPVGALIMRAADVVIGFPTLLVALLALYVFGPNLINLAVVLGITRMPVYIRVARAEAMSLRQRLFVDASVVLGGSSGWIIARHLLPLLAPTMLSVASLNLALVMLFESGLSYIGLGIQPPSVSWGLMVSQGQPYLATAWWLSFFPGLSIMLTTMSFNLLANWLRTALDPRQAWRFETTEASK